MLVVRGSDKPEWEILGQSMTMMLIFFDIKLQKALVSI
jgi:hypothetical protein